MLRHLTARSMKRAFSMRLGGNPEVLVNADTEGILRAPPPQRGDPIENGIPIEEAFPAVAESLLSRYPDLIADERPKPAPEDEDQAPAIAATEAAASAPAPDPQPSTKARRAPTEAPAQPATDTKEAEG